MGKIEYKDILNLDEEFYKLRLVGSVNGEDINIELDKIASIMLIGYLSKKNLLNKIIS